MQLEWFLGRSTRLWLRLCQALVYLATAALAFFGFHNNAISVLGRGMAFNIVLAISVAGLVVTFLRVYLIDLAAPLAKAKYPHRYFTTALDSGFAALSCSAFVWLQVSCTPLDHCASNPDLAEAFYHCTALLLTISCMALQTSLALVSTAHAWLNARVAPLAESQSPYWHAESDELKRDCRSRENDPTPTPLTTTLDKALRLLLGILSSVTAVSAAHIANTERTNQQLILPQNPFLFQLLFAVSALSALGNLALFMLKARAFLQVPLLGMSTLLLFVMSGLNVVHRDSVLGQPEWYLETNAIVAMVGGCLSTAVSAILMGRILWSNTNPLHDWSFELMKTCTRFGIVLLNLTSLICALLSLAGAGKNLDLTLHDWNTVFAASVMSLVSPVILFLQEHTKNSQALSTKLNVGLHGLLAIVTASGGATGLWDPYCTEDRIFSSCDLYRVASSVLLASALAWSGLALDLYRKDPHHAGPFLPQSKLARVRWCQFGLTVVVWVLGATISQRIEYYDRNIVFVIVVGGMGSLWSGLALREHVQDSSRCSPQPLKSNNEDDHEKLQNRFVLAVDALVLSLSFGGGVLITIHSTVLKACTNASLAEEDRPQEPRICEKTFSIVVCCFMTSLAFGLSLGLKSYRRYREAQTRGFVMATTPRLNATAIESSTGEYPKPFLTHPRPKLKKNKSSSRRKLDRADLGLKTTKSKKDLDVTKSKKKSSSSKRGKKYRSDSQVYEI